MDKEKTNRLIEAYDSGKVDGIIKEIKKIKIANEQKIKYLFEIFQWVLSRDILEAKKLNEYVLILDEYNSRGYMYKAFIEYQLGEYTRARKSLEQMYSKMQPSINEKINGANILVRLGELSFVEKILLESFDEAKKELILLEPLMYICLKLASWDYVEQLIKIFEIEYEKGNFKLIQESPRTHLLWCENEIFNNKVVEVWSHKYFPKISNIKIPVRSLQNRKIKIAYISSDFKEHPTSYLISGLLKNHNKNLFELYMMDASIEDGSLIRQQLISYFDHVYDIVNANDEEVANLIRTLHIDVVIDLNGPTKNHRMGILSYRCAPLQISYLAYPGSVGGRFVDYIIGDNYTVQSDMLNTYKEHVIKIEETYQINDYLNRKALKKVTKKTYGFDNKQIILGVFNAVNKIRKDVWLVWMQILKKTNNTVIWLLDPGKEALENIKLETKKAKINPNRIIVAPKMDQESHLNRLQICDLMLDTWPYSGHTSTSDALFAKVPVLTKEGKNFTCRVSGGLLKAAGFEELICKDIDQYKEIAIKLLSDKKKLKQIKDKLKKEVMQSDLFNAKSKTIQIEKAIMTILNRKLQNLPDVHINMKKPISRPLLSIVTVCKNRLDHLKKTLPLMCQQRNCEVILVDYSCPQKCGEWAKKNYPQVKVVMANETGEFCLPKGRNIGGFKANGKYIMFVDADVFLKADFASWIENNCNENNFYQALDQQDSSLAGTVIVAKEKFQLLNGYDEAFVGWGGEDDDLYSRLEYKNVFRQYFPNGSISAIDHGDEERQFGQSEELMQTKLEAHKVNSMYRRIKYDLMKLLGKENLDFQMRKELMQNVKNQIKKLKNGANEARIEIQSEPQGPFKLNRTLVYTMR